MKSYFDDSMKMHSSCNRVREVKTCSGSYLDGEVVTKFGIVSAYCEAGKNAHTRLDFVHGGRLHMRNIRRAYTTRGIATLAYRFAKSFQK